jgi:23S rRNA pseudouridine2605 synthase
MAAERLQKILSRAGIASRRRAEELIAAGLVTVNGQVAQLGDQADPLTDAIKVEGRRVPPAVVERFLVVHKPPGVVSTVSDPEGRPTVLELIPAGMRKALMPVGRLDFHTEGLLLLTTDGEWAQRIAHPRYGCLKVYEAKVKGMPDRAAVERLRQGGMWIEGKRTRPAEVRFLRSTGRDPERSNSWWEIVLGEGRTRQVREMFFRVGHPVQRLRRVAIGPLRDPRLDPGQWRELTAAEVELLRRAGKAGVARSMGSRGRSSAPKRGVPRGGPPGGGPPRGKIPKGPPRGGVPGAGAPKAGAHQPRGAKTGSPKSAQRGGGGQRAGRAGAGAAKPGEPRSGSAGSRTPKRGSSGAGARRGPRGGRPRRG